MVVEEVVEATGDEVDLLLEEEVEEEVVVLDRSEVTLFFTRDGYFKKITPLSLRMSGEQKLKENDEIIQQIEATNAHELLFFTNQQQVYKSRTSEFADSKASLLGDYVPSKLEMDAGESTVFMAATEDYKGYFIFVFENGRMAKVAVSSYQTKTNRHKLIKAYCDKFPLLCILHILDDEDILLKSTNGRVLIVNTSNIPLKAAKDNGGIAVMTQKRGQKIESARLYSPGMLKGEHRHRSKSVPAVGSKPSTDTDDTQSQIEL